jgi:hypothetical protein
MGECGTLQFNASVTRTNRPAQTVTWSIKGTGRNGGTTINISGLLTVASAEALTTLTVVAASTVDPSMKGEKTVSVIAGGGTPGGDALLTWTAVADTKFGTSRISGIAYGGGKFVAVGNSSKAAYSNPQQ